MKTRLPASVNATVLTVVVHAVFRFVRQFRQVIQIALVVAVHQMDRQPERDDRVQRRRRHQIAAVNDSFGAERFGVRDRGGEVTTVVMGIGNDADFHGILLRAMSLCQLQCIYPRISPSALIKK